MTTILLSSDFIYLAGCFDMQYKRILLIDDDEDDQELFQLALGELNNNIDCTVMAGAREALVYLKSEPKATDLIFLDLNMPIMTGQQFLAEIKHQPAIRGIPIIILSTTLGPPSVSDEESLGAMQFFTKPGNFHELKKILQNILD
ncbi:MAG TPA: response regulator [Puia sp.]|nr:response regulator [Puia sp.]